MPDQIPDDRLLLDRLQLRGEFYASVSVSNHYLEYAPDSFYPVVAGFSSHSARPLAKAGRVMVDVRRGIVEGHLPVRGSSSDGLADTVKEAIKLFEQSKRTGVTVPFRTAILPGFTASQSSSSEMVSDRSKLWQAWPMLTGFSFTARVWGKLLLGMPHKVKDDSDKRQDLVRRRSKRKMGVEFPALGGEGSSSTCNFIQFQEQAFEQLVLDPEKKELVRAVARNAGGAHFDDDDESDDDGDDFEEVGIDVVGNKGGASIFLLAGPPGTRRYLSFEYASFANASLSQITRLIFITKQVAVRLLLPRQSPNFFGSRYILLQPEILE